MNKHFKSISNKIKSLKANSKQTEQDFKEKLKQLKKDRKDFFKKIKIFQKDFTKKLSLSKQEKGFFSEFYEETKNKFRKTNDELFQKRKDFKTQMTQKKVELTRELKDWQKEFKTNLLKYVFTAKVRHLLSAPFIYAPFPFLVILDLVIEIYHRICFKLYRLPYVKRSDYIIIDRHKLAYLNLIEKINCCYCGYGNWLVAYWVKLFGETEKYWCPIKHNDRVKNPHPEYEEFADYEDAQTYKEIIKEIRCKKKSQPE